jgi:DNA replication and repair protein RecF
MSLQRLDIHQVRNVSSARLDLNPRFNVFFGPNGSGKTTLLESIYLLGSGHSFRARETEALVSYDAPDLSVFGEMIKGDSISIKKTKSKTIVSLNKQKCCRSSDLARYFPCQVFYQDIFEIMDAGPAVRRSLLDWGLFHASLDYHTVWKDYKRVLKQRNTLLRQSAHRKQFAPWDEQLVCLSQALHEFRAAYFEAWFHAFNEILPVLTSFSCTLAYDKGWDKKNENKGLDEILEQQFAMDLQRQYTHSGAHQADVLFEARGKKAKQTLSRGQQKMVLIALKLAQAKLLPDACAYLFDDVTTELDEIHINGLFEALEQIQGQIFFTSIRPDLFKKTPGLDKAAFFQLSAGSVSRET